MACECGCGGEPTLGRRFVHGHNRRKAPAYWVNPYTGCWVWAHHVGDKGYGHFRHGGRTVKAHRYYYERAKGPIPSGMQLDHLCRNRRCVNPDHLEPVTNAENARRGIGTKLTEAQVREVRASTESSYALAPRLGVAAVTVQAIRQGRIWKGVVA